MEKLSLSLIFASFLCFLVSCDGSESPQFTVVYSEFDFEVRLYNESSWMSAPVRGISFEKATREGFHRIFQYIEGGNLNSSKIRMTTPVLTSIVPEAGPLHSSAYVVRFYLPAEIQTTPPVPLPELNLQLDARGHMCVAVRKFSGFARDGNIVKEAEKLAVSLSRSPWANSTMTQSKDSYSIAQYDSPFRLIGRLNEVWVDVAGSARNGCGFSRVRVSTY
ncbi:PREDICTED: heme-binding protein 2-like [Nelumbo nucifera]|uniref:Heme-binding protein 2-like n=1 Tax=Nelumbo nucifera TaxID=4432 RepID=A0A1U7ZC55_NELNU|nr:PREDICTED: heme-binding protein 2-like [Nelumbo nucifera]